MSSANVTSIGRYTTWLLGVGTLAVCGPTGFSRELDLFSQEEFNTSLSRVSTSFFGAEGSKLSYVNELEVDTVEDLEIVPSSLPSLGLKWEKGWSSFSAATEPHGIPLQSCTSEVTPLDLTTSSLAKGVLTSSGLLWDAFTVTVLLV